MARNHTAAQASPLRPVGTVAEEATAATTDELLGRVSKGDRDAFAALYDRVGGQVYGIVRRVLRDPAQSEEVAQDVLLEIWRTAARFDPARGKATTYILTIAHRRAVDRVRSEQASRNREERVGTRDRNRPYDSVAEVVEARFEHEQVRRSLDQLTELQREAVELAYYGGYTYREVAQILDTPLGTIKTRLRDGLIRLRDTMGVST